MRRVIQTRMTGQRLRLDARWAIGQLKAKIDWEIRAWWQHAEQYALDPNLVDSDIFDSRVNDEGPSHQSRVHACDAISA